MRVAERPDDMLLRQFRALRSAIKYRNPETGKRHHCHVREYRSLFARGVREFRDELKRRGLWPSGFNPPPNRT